VVTLLAENIAVLSQIMFYLVPLFRLSSGSLFSSHREKEITRQAVSRALEMIWVQQCLAQPLFIHTALMHLCSQIHLSDAKSKDWLSAVYFLCKRGHNIIIFHLLQYETLFSSAFPRISFFCCFSFQHKAIRKC